MQIKHSFLLMWLFVQPAAVLAVSDVEVEFLRSATVRVDADENDKDHINRYIEILARINADPEVDSARIAEVYEIVSEKKWSGDTRALWRGGTSLIFYTKTSLQYAKTPLTSETMLELAMLRYQLHVLLLAFKSSKKLELTLGLLKTLHEARNVMKGDFAPLPLHIEITYLLVEVLDRLRNTISDSSRRDLAFQIQLVMYLANKNVSAYPAHSVEYRAVRGKAAELLNNFIDGNNDNFFYLRSFAKKPNANSNLPSTVSCEQDLVDLMVFLAESADSSEVETAKRMIQRSAPWLIKFAAEQEDHHRLSQIIDRAIPGAAELIGRMKQVNFDLSNMCRRAIGG